MSRYSVIVQRTTVEEARIEVDANSYDSALDLAKKAASDSGHAHEWVIVHDGRWHRALEAERVAVPVTPRPVGGGS